MEQYKETVITELKETGHYPGQTSDPDQQTMPENDEQEENQSQQRSY